MTAAASLALLKGAKNPAVAEQLAAKTAAPEDSTVDIDAMDESAIDSLVEANEIEVPDTWSGMHLKDKKKWFKENFEEAPDAPSETKTVEQIADANGGLQTDAQEDKKGKSKKKAGKSVAKSDAKSGEVIAKDYLQDMVYEIETLKADQLVPALEEMMDETEQKYFKLGGLFKRITDEESYKPDYPTFKDFVEQKYGIKLRSALYWIDIYCNLSESGIPWEKIKNVGWTKLKEIASILTQDNVDQWVQTAMGLNTINLIEAVRAFKNKDKQLSAPDGGQAQTVTTKTFKLHEDQKVTVETALEKAKAQSGTTVDTVALEYICLDFNGGDSLSKKLKAMGLEAALNAVQEVFPNANISVELTDDEQAA